MSDMYEKPARVFIEFYKISSRFHFFHQDPGWVPKRQPKARQWKCLTSRKTRMSFYWILRGLARASLFSTRIQDEDPRDNPMDKKQNDWHVEKPNEFLLNFMESYQDITFSTRIQDGIPKDNQSHKKGNVWQAEKTLTLFYWSLRGPFKTWLFPTRIQDVIPRDIQRHEKENVCRIEKPSDFDAIFARTCQDHTFAARNQVGAPRDSQRNENGKCLMGKKHKRLLCEFRAHLSGSHFCSKDPSRRTKGHPKEWKWKISDG